MTRCLDEATLQTYFDGELSRAMMESATLHLASCATCAAAAREIQEEIQTMTAALAAEFEASVPTERLRQRIDAAVLDHRIEVASAPVKAGIGSFVSGLPGFGTQRTLGYASLAVVLAFGAIFGLGKLTITPPPQKPVAQTNTPVRNERVAVAPQQGKEVESQVSVPAKNTYNNRAVAHKPAKPTNRINAAAGTAPQAVKLLPGERSYLQTIARLDTTIKANQKSMRPSLQVEYERNLAVVDQAIAATRSAAKSNPNDPDAADFMFAAYQSKVDLLNTIADARLGGGRSH